VLRRSRPLRGRGELGRGIHGRVRLEAHHEAHASAGTRPPAAGRRAPRRTTSSAAPGMLAPGADHHPLADRDHHHLGEAERHEAHHQLEHARRGPRAPTHGAARGRRPRGPPPRARPRGAGELHGESPARADALEHHEARTRGRAPPPRRGHRTTRASRPAATAEAPGEAPPAVLGELEHAADGEDGHHGDRGQPHATPTARARGAETDPPRARRGPPARAPAAGRGPRPPRARPQRPAPRGPPAPAMEPRATTIGEALTSSTPRGSPCRAPRGRRRGSPVLEADDGEHHHAGEEATTRAGGARRGARARPPPRPRRGPRPWAPSSTTRPTPTTATTTRTTRPPTLATLPRPVLHRSIGDPV
jgi:hypothetical protein